MVMVNLRPIRMIHSGIRPNTHFRIKTFYLLRKKSEFSSGKNSIIQRFINKIIYDGIKR